LKLKNYTSTKKSKIILILLFASTFLFLQSVQAENKCKPEMLAELKKESEQIKAKIKANNPNDVDLKFYKTDRTDPFLQQFNAVGGLTSGPMGETKGFGSAILFDKCFVLTNKHVLWSNLQKINQKLKIGSVQYFHIGQASTCSLEDPMAIENVKATVVDFGGNDDFPLEDWAVLKLEKPITAIDPVKTYRGRVQENQAFFRAGYPGAILKSDDFGASAVRVQQVRSEQVADDGLLITSDTELRKGLSGSGIFYLSSAENKKPYLYIYAIHVGGDKEVTLWAIFKKMGENGRKIMEEIKRPKAPGTCE